ncbi:YPDG domain-containing protein [Corynebacterium otitidis]|uniref:YPDG domain-containing protein n=1 Tax=Corynebacterium otitidis TaxID=29321 RepID=UPI00069C12FF|nr:YPDG domain-containing protein [Corynebacterium otitidis]
MDSHLPQRSASARALAGIQRPGRLTRGLLGAGATVVLTVTSVAGAGIAGAQEAPPQNPDDVAVSTTAPEGEGAPEVDPEGGEPAEAPAAPEGEEAADAEDPAEPPAEAPAAEAIPADAIAQGIITDGAQLENNEEGASTISGHAWVVNPRPIGWLTTNSRHGNEGAPAGTAVYAQWIDADGSVSPVYSAAVHELPDHANGGTGAFAFKIPEWTDANGTKHVFGSDQANQRFRIWADDTVNPSTGNELVQFRQSGAGIPNAFRNFKPEMTNEGVVKDAPGNIHRTALWFYEKPGDYVSAEKPIQPKEPLLGPIGDLIRGNHFVDGRVWIERGNDTNTAKAYNGIGDRGADGYTVHVSTLTHEGSRANRILKVQDPAKKAERTKALLEEHPEYIAATSSAKVDKDGKFRVRFPKDTDYNQHNLYIWVEDPEGNVVPGYSAYHQPVFNAPNYNTPWLPPLDPFDAGDRWRDVLREGIDIATKGPGVIPQKILDLLKDKENWKKLLTNNIKDGGGKWMNVNIALIDAPGTELSLDRDHQENPARPGDEVSLSVDGKLANLENSVVWYGPDGEEVRECGVTPEQAGECAKLEVPKDAENGDVYTAVLRSGDHVVAATSFLVQAEPHVIGYDELRIAPDAEERTASAEPTLTTADGEPVEAHEGSTFAFGEELPEGLAADEENPNVLRAGEPEGEDEIVLELDPETGKLTLTAGPAAELPEEGLTVPVEQRGPLGQLEGQGEARVFVAPAGADDEGEISDEVGRPVYETVMHDQDKDAEGIQSGTPFFVDDEGELAKAPEDVHFALGEGAPEGATVDEKTGVVTVPESALTGVTLNVPVVVTSGADEDYEAKASVRFSGSLGGETEEPELEATLAERFQVEYDDVADGRDEADENVRRSGEPTLVEREVQPDEQDNPGDEGQPGEEPEGEPEPEAVSYRLSAGEENLDGTATETAESEAVEAQVKPGARKVPEGTRFELIKETAPKGASVDEKTGEVTLTGAATDTDVVVPLKVTFPDGSETVAEVRFLALDKDEDNEESVASQLEVSYEPVKEDQDEDAKGVQSGRPVFADRSGKKVEAPEGARFELIGSSPEGTTIDEKTGVVTLPEFPADKPALVPVLVRYADGSHSHAAVEFAGVEPQPAPPLVNPDDKPGQPEKPGDEGEKPEDKPKDEGKDDDSKGGDAKGDGETEKPEGKDNGGIPVGPGADDAGQVPAEPDPEAIDRAEQDVHEREDAEGEKPAGQQPQNAAPQQQGAPAQQQGAPSSLASTGVSGVLAIAGVGLAAVAAGAALLFARRRQ